MDERVDPSSEFNPAKSYLGSLCKNGHDYQGTGQSVRQLSNKACRFCLILHATKPRSERTERRDSPEEYFALKVDVRTADECWLWKGCVRDQRNRGNYGAWSYVEPIRGIKPKGAHQATYLIFTGDIPEGQIVRHTCDQPLCCNPAHLQLGSVADNNRDRDERGRWVNWYELPQYANHPRVLSIKQDKDESLIRTSPHL